MQARRRRAVEGTASKRQRTGAAATNDAPALSRPLAAIPVPPMLLSLANTPLSEIQVTAIDQSFDALQRVTQLGKSAEGRPEAIKILKERVQPAAAAIKYLVQQGRAAEVGTLTGKAGINAAKPLGNPSARAAIHEPEPGLGAVHGG